MSKLSNPDETASDELPKKIDETSMRTDKDNKLKIETIVKNVIDRNLQ